MKVCSLYGAGFYYVPGTDICLKVGAYFRAEYAVGNHGQSLTNLDITGAQNGADLLTSELRILDAPAVPGRAVERGPRIGVDYAKEWAQAPLRFWVRGSPGVSGGRRPRALG